MLAQKTRYFSPYKRLVVRRSHQHNDCGRLIILTQGQTYWFYLSISLEAKKLSLSGHTRLYYMFGSLLFSCVELNPVYILNNMLFISINVLASMFTISIIISLSGCCKNRIEGCGTQKTIIKVHNMTSDIIAKPPDYADRRELKSLSYFGI